MGNQNVEFEIFISSKNEKMFRKQLKPREQIRP